jgi:hypothetical protein
MWPVRCLVNNAHIFEVGIVLGIVDVNVNPAFGAIGGLIDGVPVVRRAGSSDKMTWHRAPVGSLT